MKKYILIITMILTALFYFILPLSADPIIEISDVEFNFGELLPGQSIHHTYIVKNKGTKDLIIHEVSPSCGCTTAMLLEKTVPPGKSVKIEADLIAQMNDGVIRKNINVLSNDPKNPKVIIYLNATVKGDYQIEPKKITFGEMFIGEKKEFIFQIKPVNKKPFDPAKIEYNKTIFKVSQKALNPEEPLSPVEFTVEYFASSIFKARNAFDVIKVFPYKDNLSLHLDIPFEGKIKGYIQQSASSIFRKAKKGQGYKELVRFNHLKEKPFKIISAISSNQNVTTNIIKKSEFDYDVEINLKEGSILNKNGTESKREQVAIVVNTDQEDSKEMRIYMTFLIN